MILCDIGNTTFHFLIKKQSSRYLLDEEIPKFDEQVYFISVNEKATKKLLETNPSAINLKEYVSFNTKYEGQGIDRVFVCLFQTNIIIVDAGSAIKVDIMEKGNHKGGFILPGFNSYKKIYPEISKVLELDLEREVNLDKIPLNTKDAIFYAVLKSIILPIKEISKDKTLLFTGGDGLFLSKYFKNSIYDEDLIFKNMKRIINANNCITKR